MKPSELPKTKWYIIKTTGEYYSTGKNVSMVQLRSGQKGYIKRNKHTPNYFQVLAKVADGSIAGWYIKDTEADQIIEVVREAPAEANPETHWKTFWNTTFQK